MSWNNIKNLLMHYIGNNSRQRADTKPTKIFYLHIPKAAGTTVERFILDNVQPQQPIRYLNQATMGFVTDAELNSKDYISGHAGFGLTRRLSPNYFKFTFMRDPIDRTVSHYYYFRHYPHVDEAPGYRLAREMSLEDFVRAALDGQPNLQAQIVDMQTWMLFEAFQIATRARNPTVSQDALLNKAKAHLDMLDFVGVQEDLEAGLRVLGRQLGVTKAWTPSHHNKTSSRPKVDQLSDSERDVILAATRLDRELYAYGLKRWTELAAAQHVEPTHQEAVV